MNTAWPSLESHNVLLGRQKERKVTVIKLRSAPTPGYCLGSRPASECNSSFSFYGSKKETENCWSRAQLRIIKKRKKITKPSKENHKTHSLHLTHFYSWESPLDQTQSREDRQETLLEAGHHITVTTGEENSRCKIISGHST